MADHDEEEEFLEIGILLLLSRQRNRKARKVPSNILDLSLKSGDCLLYNRYICVQPLPVFFFFNSAASFTPVLRQFYVSFKAGPDSAFVFFR